MSSRSGSGASAPGTRSTARAAGGKAGAHAARQSTTARTGTADDRATGGRCRRRTRAPERAGQPRMRGEAGSGMLARHVEVDRADPAARPQQRRRVVQGREPVRHHGERIGEGDDVDRGLVRLERRPVADDRLDVSPAARPGTLPRPADQRRGEIHDVQPPEPLDPGPRCSSAAAVPPPTSTQTPPSGTRCGCREPPARPAGARATRRRGPPGRRTTRGAPRGRARGPA